MWEFMKMMMGIFAVLLPILFIAVMVRYVMPDVLVALVLRMVAAVRSALSLGRKTPAEKMWGQATPYTRKPYLLSVPEKRFYDILAEVVPLDVCICPQVSLGGILDVTSDPRDYLRHWNRISSKRLDFLLCDRNTLSPLVAIELDDASHDAPRRQKRDRFVENALASAGLAILRFRVHRSYRIGDIEAAVGEATRAARVTAGLTLG